MTQALHSLFRNAHVAHMKRSSHSIRSQTMRHVKSYLNGTSILSLARKCNYPPSMMARLIVENVTSPPAPPADRGAKGSTTNRPDGSDPSGGSGSAKSATATAKSANNNARKFVTEALRHPERVLGSASASVLPEYQFSEKNFSASRREDVLGKIWGRERRGSAPKEKGEGCDRYEIQAPELSRLCLEVREAIDADPMYGESRRSPRRQCVGLMEWDTHPLMLCSPLQISSAQAQGMTRQGTTLALSTNCCLKRHSNPWVSRIPKSLLRILLLCLTHIVCLTGRSVKQMHCKNNGRDPIRDGGRAPRSRDGAYSGHPPLVSSGHSRSQKGCDKAVQARRI